MDRSQISFWIWPNLSQKVPSKAWMWKRNYLTKMQMILHLQQWQCEISSVAFMKAEMLPMGSSRCTLQRSGSICLLPLHDINKPHGKVKPGLSIVTPWTYATVSLPCKKCFLNPMMNAFWAKKLHFENYRSFQLRWKSRNSLNNSAKNQILLWNISTQMKIISRKSFFI